MFKKGSSFWRYLKRKKCLIFTTRFRTEAKRLRISDVIFSAVEICRDEAKARTHGVSGARCKKFNTNEEAKNYLSKYNNSEESGQATGEIIMYQPSTEKRVASKILSKNKSYFYKPLAVGKKTESISPSKSDICRDTLTKAGSSHVSQSDVIIIDDDEPELDVIRLKRNRSPVDTVAKADESASKKLRVCADSSVSGGSSGINSLHNCNGVESIDLTSTCGTTEDLWGDEDEDVFSAIPEHLLTEDASGSSKKSSKQSSKSTKSSFNGVKDSTNHSGNGGNFAYDDSGSVVVFTDGACSKNGQSGAQAGLGVWFNHNHPLNLAEPVEGCATNNNAEIQAATRAIQQAIKAGIAKLNINTDSQFLIGCITQWIHSWKKNNWRLASGGPVKNKEQLLALDSVMKSKVAVSWTHVRGHTGNVGNEAADKLAREGALLYKQRPSANDHSDPEDLGEITCGNGSEAKCNKNDSESSYLSENGNLSQIKREASPEDYLLGRRPLAIIHNSDTRSRDSESSNFLYDLSENVKVFVDGACLNNGRPNAQAGVGVWFNHNHPLNLFEAVKGPATNINAEIQAAIRGIQQASKAGVKKLNVNTDSKFLIQCIEDWLPRWKKNCWRSTTGAAIKNKEELEVLDSVIQSLSSVTWNYVKGHSGIIGQEDADKLAKQGATLYKPKTEKMSNV